ncbi:hypothetical protein K402DRAFT_395481 [Aulographum hederae CBS 113979]|uniref:F-box domain-containing protein n=1 Tax=Aulographum hederae CBS 113979 TaxID=1176131 RepID=A0A6G1GV06_9PEZI|nr:hypothetical protein K402DRAFT_395481 [Aulographum hederae CBS 113979]
MGGNKKSTAAKKKKTAQSAAPEPNLVNSMKAMSFSSKPSEQPLASFPIPIELRNQIYSYLLKSDSVRVQEKGKRHSYKFQTSILAVNKAIHDEAQEYLYKNNCFVVVSYRWVNLPKDLATFCVPVVTETKAAKMKEHSLRIHFEWPASKMSCSCCPPENNALGSFLMVAEDHENLLRMLRIFNIRIRGEHLFVTSARDEQVDFYPQADAKKTVLKIQFRDTPYFKTTNAFYRRTLEPFKQVRGVGQKVTITGGTVDPDYVKEVCTAMYPKVVWASALGWDLLELAKSWKKDADRAVEGGQLQLAWNQLEFIARVITTSIIPEEAQHTATYVCSCSDFRIGLDLLSLDCAVMLLAIGLKLNRSACSLGHPYITAVNLAGSLGYIPAYTFHRAVQWGAMISAMTDDWEGTKGLLSKITELKTSGHSVTCQGYVQDLVKARKHTLKYRTSSLYGGPVEVINSDWSPTKPSGLIGWQDHKHQLRLSEDAVELNIFRLFHVTPDMMPPFRDDEVLARENTADVETYKRAFCYSKSQPPLPELPRLRHAPPGYDGGHGY